MFRIHVCPVGDMEYTCRLMLPTMGVFIIEICMEGIVDKDVEKTVCRRVPLGKTEKDWKSRYENNLSISRNTAFLFCRYSRLRYGFQIVSSFLIS